MSCLYLFTLLTDQDFQQYILRYIKRYNNVIMYNMSVHIVLNMLNYLCVEISLVFHTNYTQTNYPFSNQPITVYILVIKQIICQVFTRNNVLKKLERIFLQHIFTYFNT